MKEKHRNDEKIGRWPKRQQPTPRDPKPCAHCGRDMSKLKRGDGRIISPYSLQLRKYCNRACASAAAQQQTREHYQAHASPCTICGAQIPYTKNWSTRKTCSDKCQKIAHKLSMMAREQAERDTVQIQLTPADTWLERHPATNRPRGATCIANMQPAQYRRWRSATHNTREAA